MNNPAKERVWTMHTNGVAGFRVKLRDSYRLVIWPGCYEITGGTPSSTIDGTFVMFCSLEHDIHWLCLMILSDGHRKYYLRHVVQYWWFKFFEWYIVLHNCQSFAPLHPKLNAFSSTGVSKWKKSEPAAGKYWLKRFVALDSEQVTAVLPLYNVRPK